MFISWVIMAYLTPETLVPATSVIATIAGIGMIIGRSSFRFLIRCGRRSLRLPSRIQQVNEPHFRLRDEEACRVFRR